MSLFGGRKNGRVKTKIKGTFEVTQVYTCATSNAPVISVLTAPFSLPRNRALLLRIMSLFGGRKNGRVKTKIKGTFEVAQVYIMIMAPEISVIFSTYCRNHGDDHCLNFLERALQSILAQTFTRIELILIDDGSTDGSAEVSKKYAESDSRIRYIRFEQNSRLPALRYNQGISLSKGRWIAFMFDDDEWLPNALEDLYGQANSLPSIYGLVNGFVQFNHIQNGVYSAISSDFGKGSDSFYKLFLDNKLANNSVLVRREVFDFVGGYDESKCMRRVCDWDLWLRISMRYKFKVVPKTVAIVNQGLPDSLLNNIVLNQHLVYARQLMFFRKLALRKYYLRMSREQWLRFLALLVQIPFYLCIRYGFLYFGVARKGLGFVYRYCRRIKV